MKRFNISYMNLKTPDYFGFYKMETKKQGRNIVQCVTCVLFIFPFLTLVFVCTAKHTKTNFGNAQS